MADGPGMIEAVRGKREEYSSGAGLGALAESVRLGRAALAGGGPLQGSAALELGASLGLLYGATGELRHLEESQALFQQAVSLLPSGHPDLAAVYTNIAANLVQRFQRLGRREDLAVAAEAARQGIGASMPGDPNLAGRHTNLGEVLRMLYHATGDPKFLDDSITAGRAGVAEMTAATHAKPMVLASVAGGLYLRGLAKGSTGDLEESTALARRAVACASLGSVWGQNAGTILAAAMRARFELTGEISCLSEAIVLHRENADRVPSEQPEYATHLLHLAASLLLRYERQEDGADLDAADDAASRARGSGNALSVPEAWSLTGICWRYRAENLAAAGDRAAAERAAQEAVEASAQALAQPAVRGQDPDHRVRHCNALAARYELTGTRAHRAEAAAAYRGVIDSLGGDSPAGQLALLNLGIVLLRHEAQAPAGEADVREAARYFRNLLSGSSSVPGGRLWTSASFGLIRAMSQLFVVAPQDVDTAELEVLYRQVTAVHGVPPKRRAAAGLLAGRVLLQAGQAGAASWILTDAVRQLPAVAWRGARRATRESQLEGFSELGGDAAASHLLAGGDDPEAPLRAAEAVEQGRAVLWADMLQLRREDESLEHRQPELAARLRELAAALDVPDQLQGDGLDDSRGVDRRMALAVEWDQVISEVRREAPGFLQPPELADQLPAAGHGPVVIVNVSSLRCDALIVTAAGVRAVPLPSLSAADISRQTAKYLDAYERLAPTRTPRADSTATAKSPDEVLSQLLEWLWETVAGPVLSALGIDGPPQPGRPLPRIWWCPTGLLSLLPLHAAGYHDPVPSGEVPRTVLDRAVSSYTPTLGALAAASRAKVPAGRGDGDLLFVGLPETPGEDLLASARRDRDVITRSLGAHRHDLFGHEATVAAVRSRLASFPWVHFSCHGEQNLTAPSTGGLKLWDGTLTIADLSAQDVAGEFAFLAACQTATGGSTLPNEAISLAAALHFAGYRHVVATLSPVYENAAAQVTEMLYRDLAVHAQLAPAAAARALHAAVLALRDTDRTSPSWWASFIHIGP